MNKISPEMFDALLAIMDIKVAKEAARDSSDGGMFEWAKEMELVADFKARFVEDVE